MPNQRKKGKQFVGAWVNQSTYRRLRRTAKEGGGSVTDVIVNLVETQLSTEALHDKPATAPSVISPSASGGADQPASSTAAKIGPAGTEVVQRQVIYYRKDGRQSRAARRTFRSNPRPDGGAAKA